MAYKNTIKNYKNCALHIITNSIKLEYWCIKICTVHKYIKLESHRKINPSTDQRILINKSHIVFLLFYNVMWVGIMNICGEICGESWEI